MPTKRGEKLSSSALFSSTELEFYLFLFFFWRLAIGQHSLLKKRKRRVDQDLLVLVRTSRNPCLMATRCSHRQSPPCWKPHGSHYPPLPPSAPSFNDSHFRSKLGVFCCSVYASLTAFCTSVGFLFSTAGRHVLPFSLFPVWPAAGAADSAPRVLLTPPSSDSVTFRSARAPIEWAAT